jgi:hypothetical protein
MAAVVKTPWDNRFVARGHSNSKIDVPNLSLMQGIDGKRRHATAVRRAQVGVEKRFRGPIQYLTLTMTKLNCGTYLAKL